MRGLVVVCLLLVTSLVSADERTRLSAQQRALTARHLDKGRALLAARQSADAAAELALAHALSPSRELLFEVARTCRRSAQDDDALAIYLRIQQEDPSLQRAEVEEAISLLRLKLEDMELDPAQVLRDRMEQAKQKFLAADYEAATRSYAMAYAIKPLPRLIFNIAQAYRRGRQAPAAYLMYTRYLEAEPSTPLKKEVLTSLDELHDAALPPPLWKRAWFWGVLGAVALTGVAVGVGVGIARRDNPPVLRFIIP